MRHLMLVAVAAMGVAGLFAPWGAERASACSIAPPVLQGIGGMAHIVVVGTLSNTDQPVALLEVERAYKRPAPSTVLRIDARRIGIGAFCEKEYMDEPGYHDGRVVVFLERTDPGGDADYEVTWFGMGVSYVEEGMVGYWWGLDPSGWVTTTLEVMEERLRETVGGPWPLLTATPAPTATVTEATVTGRPSEQATSSATPVEGDNVTQIMVWDWKQARNDLSWLAAGVVLGAAGVGGVWWVRGRGAGR